MKIIGIIPARLESSRLPEKALLDICGIPMVIHTYKRSTLATRLDEVYVATDNEKIKKVVEQYGGKVIMTRKDHKTGSDRIAEACLPLEADIIVNIQGDEPLLNPAHIDTIIEPLIHDKSVKISVGVTPYYKEGSTSDIKAVLNLNNEILYCSRTDIPDNSRTPSRALLKMCFIVPFRKEFLLQYTSWQSTPLELIEYNEYLRVLEHGEKIKAVFVEGAHISVDTPSDLVEVRKLMKNDTIIEKYLKK